LGFGVFPEAGAFGFGIGFDVEGGFGFGADGVEGELIGREFAKRFGVEVAGSVRVAAAQERFDTVPEGVVRQGWVEVVREIGNLGVFR
jgi:hypothetical protein